MKRILAIGIILLFIASSISLSNNAGVNVKNERIVARITYRCNKIVTTSLQPLVIITSPKDGAVVTDPHLVVLGYAQDEAGMNYWEWEWHYKGGSKSNSSYFQTATYVEFRIDIYGLHPGWNLIIVRFKNVYGAYGEDSVNVTYNPPNKPPNKPSKPQGPTEGKVKTTLYYTTVTTDPDGDSLEYLIDWGDGSNTGWLGPITSGTPFQSFHAWDEPGTYEVRAKARDIPYHEESEWSDALIVTIYGNDTISPLVVIEWPEDGATFTQPNITITGYAEDNVGVIAWGYTHHWESGGTGSSWPLEEPSTNYSFEIPITLHNGWNRIKVYASDEAGNNGSDNVTVYYNVSIQIDLTIYNGLEGTGGGQEIPENKEENVGAFTVNNIQDTNNDGKIDADEHPVKAKSGGRDEVDLMKMILHKPVGRNINPNDNIELIKSGPNKDAVKLWGTKVKNNEIKPTNPPDKWIFKVKDLPKTVWVEIAEKNPKKLVLRGITFTLKYKSAQDVVKATAVWAEVTDVRHNNRDAWNKGVWPDMPPNVRAYINRAGGFGLRKWGVGAAALYGNVIAIEFTVYPSGIGNEPVYFDITRQIHYRDIGIGGANHPNVTLPDSENWPVQCEQPNDDTHNDDESNKPINDHMYVNDAPRFPVDGWNGGKLYWIVSENNFLEFMRVSFDKKPQGETIQGSRCSDYYPWHASLWLSKDPANPKQVTRNQNIEVHLINCVGPGFILIIDPKPPWPTIDRKMLRHGC